MRIWALLKGLDEEVSFHGITPLPDAAIAWKFGADDTWHYEMDTNDGSVIARNPITYTAAEAGTIE